MEFKIGEKVVCVDASAGESTKLISLKKNEIYTVSFISKVDNQSAILLEEVQLPQNEYGGTTYFKASRFRKLDYEFANNVITNLLKIEHHIN